MCEKVKKRLRCFLACLVAVEVLAVGSVNAQEHPVQPGSDREASLDASLIRIGQFRYVMLLQGNKFGEFSWGMERRDDGSYEVTEEASGAAGRERSRYSFTRDFVPLSVHQEGMLGELDARLDLEYDGPRIRGTATMPSDDEAEGTEQPHAEEVVVDTLVVPGTLDELMGLAAVMASPLATDRRMEVPVFSPGRGVTRFRAKVTDEVTVTVPAGVFDTYRVEISYAQATLVVYVTRDTPRHLVKEELGDGSVTIELDSTGS